MPTSISLPLLHITDPITGMPLVGGLVWTYAAGTSTPIPTYSSWDPVGGFTGANPSPIVLSNNGDATIFLTAATKIVVEYPPPVGQTHGTVLYTLPWVESPPFSSYMVLGSQVPPTPASGQLGLYCSGTNLYMKDSNGVITSPVTAQAVQQQSYTAASGGGTGDAITANFSPAITSLVDKLRVTVWAPGANTTSTPTFSPNGLAPVVIVKDNNQALLAGDIPGVNSAIQLEYNSTLGKWILLNPSVSNLLNINSASVSVKASITTLSSDSTKLITLPIVGRRYRVTFNLLQNTTAGYLSLTLNADTGANYIINNCLADFSGVGQSSDNGEGKTNQMLSWNSAGYLVAVGAPISGEFLLIPNGNKVQIMGESFNPGNGGTNYWVHLFISGQYNGAAPLTSFTLTTSAGTLTGYVTTMIEP